MKMKAFPTLADNGHVTTQDGMDLRDYFAAKAMQVYMSERNDQGEIMWEPEEIADLAYEMADAMMEARKHD